MAHRGVCGGTNGIFFAKQRRWEFKMGFEEGRYTVLYSILHWLDG